MNKKNLIDAICQKLETSSAKQGEKALNAVLDAIREGVYTDGVIQLLNFGTFRTMVRKAKKVQHPVTRVLMEIPETRVVDFSPGKAFLPQPGFTKEQKTDSF